MTGHAQAEAERLEDEAEEAEAFALEESAISRDRQRPGGRLRYLARAEGFVMARCEEYQPFTMPETEWAGLPLWAERCTCYDPSVTGISAPCRNPACVARVEGWR